MFFLRIIGKVYVMTGRAGARPPTSLPSRPSRGLGPAEPLSSPSTSLLLLRAHSSWAVGPKLLQATGLLSFSHWMAPKYAITLDHSVPQSLSSSRGDNLWRRWWQLCLACSGGAYGKLRPLLAAAAAPYFQLQRRRRRAAASTRRHVRARAASR